MKLEIKSTSAEQTEQLGRKIGAILRGGEVLLLQSDLGGGKTTLTKGIVAGAGSSDMVSSPTFTVSKEYTTPNYIIVHYDFYRLQDPGILEHEVAEYIDDISRVLVIEWGERIMQKLSVSPINISIEYTADEGRDIMINVPKKYNYVIEALR